MTVAYYAASISIAADYKVGNSAGWTLAEQSDYGEWAADKDFFVGDPLLFHYNPA
ncbi:conserved hypothetical protein [Ricinus communis]|uniref:Phytocyanin domain-containing protein n=1 Tax=Ricinus communis TaxID=3988 RepID=B9S419_RICCO|nr:conserved hypothetical protein [Ricinus communis]